MSDIDAGTSGVVPVTMAVDGVSTHTHTLTHTLPSSFIQRHLDEQCTHPKTMRQLFSRLSHVWTAVHAAEHVVIFVSLFLSSAIKQMGSAVICLNAGGRILRRRIISFSHYSFFFLSKTKQLRVHLKLTRINRSVSFYISERLDS